MDGELAGFAAFLFFVFAVGLLVWFGRRLDGIARDTKRSAEALERMERREWRGGGKTAGAEAPPVLRESSAGYGRMPGK